MSITEEQVAAACLTMLNTALAGYGVTPGTIKAYDLDEARGVTLEQVQVTCTRRYTPNERAGIGADLPYRLTTRPVADTVTNGRSIATLVDTALAGNRVVAGGVTSTPVRLESSDAIGEDDGRYSGLTTWTFVL